MKKFTYIILFLTVFGYGQSTPVFQNEVLNIQKKYDSIWDSSKETIVFTGSSSIRMWKNLEDMFPNHQIVNSGFGGSQSSDLFRYYKELILKYQPKKVFIYEGDNDIASKRKTKDIIKNMEQITFKIKEHNPKTQIILIAAKPSIARWHLKRKYIKLNRALEALSKKENNIEFANVWDVMMEKKQLKQDIFIADGLHMNHKGYDLWFSVIKPFLD